MSSEHRLSILNKDKVQEKRAQAQDGGGGTGSEPDDKSSKKDKPPGYQNHA